MLLGRFTKTSVLACPGVLLNENAVDSAPALAVTEKAPGGVPAVSAGDVVAIPGALVVGWGVTILPEVPATSAWKPRVCPAVMLPGTLTRTSLLGCPGVLLNENEVVIAPALAVTEKAPGVVPAVSAVDVVAIPEAL